MFMKCTFLLFYQIFPNFCGYHMFVKQWWLDRIYELCQLASVVVWRVNETELSWKKKLSSQYSPFSFGEPQLNSNSTLDILMAFKSLQFLGNICYWARIAYIYLKLPIKLYFIQYNFLPQLLFFFFCKNVYAEHVRCYHVGRIIFFTCPRETRVFTLKNPVTSLHKDWVQLPFI